MPRNPLRTALTGLLAAAVVACVVNPAQAARLQTDSMGRLKTPSATVNLSADTLKAAPAAPVASQSPPPDFDTYAQAYVAKLNKDLPAQLGDNIARLKLTYDKTTRTLTFWEKVTGSAGYIKRAAEAGPLATLQKAFTGIYTKDACNGPLAVALNGGFLQHIVHHYNVGDKSFSVDVTKDVCASKGHGTTTENLPDPGQDDKPLTIKTQPFTGPAYPNITRVIAISGKLTDQAQVDLKTLMAKEQPDPATMVLLNLSTNDLATMLNLADAIHLRHFATNVGALAGGRVAPGVCYRMCLLAYLGGSQRYLAAGSQIAVSPFVAPQVDGMGADGQNTVFQMLLGKAVGRMLAAHINPRLFVTMTGATPGALTRLGENTLKADNITTGTIYSQKWQIANFGAVPIVTVVQNDESALNTLAFSCNKGHINVTALLASDAPGGLLRTATGAGVTVDGRSIPLPPFSPAALSLKNAAGNRYVSFTQTLTPAQRERLLAADTVGAYITSGSLLDGALAGGIKTRSSGQDGLAMLAKLSAGCVLPAAH